MNIETRFKELYLTITNSTGAEPGDSAQAAATLLLAEVIQGTTLSVDLTNDQRRPIRVEVAQR